MPVLGATSIGSFQVNIKKDFPLKLHFKILRENCDVVIGKL